MWETLTDALRWVNVFLTSAACSLLIISMMNRWDQLTLRIKHLGIWISALLATQCYSSVEALAQDLGAGIRVPMVTICCLGIIHRILWKFNSK